MPSPNNQARTGSEISAFIRTDRQTDMARSTQLLILIRNIYTYGVRNASFCLLLWGQKRFLLPVILIYPFTLRVTGIKVPFYSTSNGYKKEERYSRVPIIKTRKNAIVEYGTIRYPVTQLKDQREMEICKQHSETETYPL